jgi:hypothetical protein
MFSSKPQISKELELALRYYAKELNPDLSKLRLLLYFTQGISFCFNDEAFFPEQFSFDNGDLVLRGVDGFGRLNLDINPLGVSDCQMEVLRHVASVYGALDSDSLRKTVLSQSPYICYDSSENGCLPNAAIADYFIGLMFAPKTERWDE